eukprot:scaffold22014_cov123-Isochrysis_galbana.AAC.4
MGTPLGVCRPSSSARSSCSASSSSPIIFSPQSGVRATRTSAPHARVPHAHASTLSARDEVPDTHCLPKPSPPSSFPARSRSRPQARTRRRTSNFSLRAWPHGAAASMPHSSVWTGREIEHSPT